MPKGNYYHFFIIPYLISLLGNYLLENSQPRMREAYRTKYTLKHFPAPSSGKCVNIKKKKKKKKGMRKNHPHKGVITFFRKDKLNEVPITHFRKN